MGCSVDEGPEGGRHTGSRNFQKNAKQVGKIDCLDGDAPELSSWKIF